MAVTTKTNRARFHGLKTVLEVEINSEYTESRLDSHTADEIKEIIFKANVKANTNTFSGKIDGQEYLISTKNFNGLIKKYAKKIFQ